MRGFAQADRFVSEVQARKLRPAYVFVGDEVFFRRRCREARSVGYRRGNNFPARSVGRVGA